MNSSTLANELINIFENASVVMAVIIYMYEKNKKEITTVAEVLNQLKICVDQTNFSFDFLGLDKVNFENSFVNQLTR